jgi:hypothetical protein
MTTTTASAPVEPVGAVRIVPLVGEEPAMRDWSAELVERACIDGFEPTSENGLLTTLVRQVLQTGLEVELTDHLSAPYLVRWRVGDQ